MYQGNYHGLTSLQVSSAVEILGGLCGLLTVTPLATMHSDREDVLSGLGSD